MKRFPGPLGKIAQRFFSTRAYTAEAQSGAARPAAAKPLAMTFRAAEDAAAATEQLFAHAQKIEDCLSDIREDVGLAWQDQSRASQEYYDLARGILLALDDLRELAAPQPGISDLMARLEGLLARTRHRGDSGGRRRCFLRGYSRLQQDRAFAPRLAGSRAGGRVAWLPPPLVIGRKRAGSARPGRCQPIAR